MTYRDPCCLMGLKMRIKLRPSRQVPPLPLSLLFPQVFLFRDMIRDERRINDETVTIPGNSDGSSEASFRDSSGRAQEYERILTDSVNICRWAKRRLSSKDVSGRNNRKIRGNESFTNKYVEIVLNFLVLTKKNEILLDVQPLSQRKSKRSDEGKNVTEKIHTCRVKIELQAAAKFWCSGRNFFDPVRPWPWRSREPNNSPSHKLVTSFRGMARITWQVGPVVNDRGWLDWNRGPVRECWWQRIPRRCARALPSLLMQS